MGVYLFSETGKYVSHVANAMLELQTIFAVNYFMLGILSLFFLFGVTAILIIISVHDLKTQEIPNGFNLTFILLSMLYLISTHLHPLPSTPTVFLKEIAPCVLAAIVAFLFFYTFVFLSKETWMGGGDAKMAFGMGLLLGPAGTFLAILIASVSGSIYGISQILIARGQKPIANSKKHVRHEVPFGPFLALGTYISMVFGTQIIDWYVKIVLGI